MKNSAFTLVELLVAVTILTVVAAITFPALSSARRSASELATVQAARQLGIALAIYRSENDGDAKYGVASEMGLPVFGSSTFLARFPFEPWWRTPCVRSESSASAGFVYWPADRGAPTNYPPSVVEAWVREAIAYEERTLLVSTLNCTPAEWDIQNQFHRKVGIGIDLGVQLRFLRKGGHATRMSWWQN